MSKAEWAMQGGFTLAAMYGFITGDILYGLVMGWLAAIAILSDRAERRDRDQWK